MSKSAFKSQVDLTDRMDMSRFGTVMARYDITYNSIEYFNKYSIKEYSSKLYKYRNKTFLLTHGRWWNWVDVQSGEVLGDGDPNIRIYEINSEESYMDLSVPIKTIQMEIEGVIPGPTLPNIEINRLDSQEPYSFIMFRGDVINTMPVTLGPRYAEYSDKFVLNIEKIIIVMNNPFWEESNSNYAWSLDNYGIDNNYS